MSDIKIQNNELKGYGQRIFDKGSEISNRFLCATH